MMVVTHEMGFAKKVAHRVIFMKGRDRRGRPQGRFLLESEIGTREGLPREDPALSDTVARRRAPVPPDSPDETTSSLNALQVFDIVARHGSFTRAAEYLCLTQGP